MKSIIYAVCKWAALLGGFIALVVGLMTCASVVKRALFTKPIQGDLELVQLGIAFSISLCLGWCQLKGANIIVDFFTSKNRPSTNKFLDGVGALLLAVMYGLLSVRTLYGAIAVKEANEATPTLDLPMWWTYACLAPGLALAAVVALYQAVMYFSGNDVELPSDGEHAK